MRNATETKATDEEKKMENLTGFETWKGTKRLAFEDAQKKLEASTESFETLLASREFTQEEMDNATNLLTDAEEEMLKAEQTWRSDADEFANWKWFGNEEDGE